MAPGGSEYRRTQDYGWKYGHVFQDVNGHVWKIFHANMDAMPEEMKKERSDELSDQVCRTFYSLYFCGSTKRQKIGAGQVLHVDLQRSKDYVNYNAQQFSPPGTAGDHRHGAVVPRVYSDLC